MKKTLSFLLLFFFLFNSVGYYFIFEIYKYRVRKNIETQGYKNFAAMVIIRIKDAGYDRELQRVEKKEIRYKGSLYDVIKEVQRGKTTIFFCIHDMKEENLLAAIKTIYKNKFLFSLWDHVIKITVPHFYLALSNIFPLKVLFPQLSVTLNSVLIVKWSPPPELT